MNERGKRRSSVLLGPESVLPTQFFRNLRADRNLRTGECQLLVAVMADAIECFQKYRGAHDSHGQRLFREAEEWIMSTEQPARHSADEQLTFSFEYCCDVLGIDASSVRSVVRRWSGEHERAA